MPQTCELTPLKAGPVHLLWESDVVKNASESHICEPSLDVKVVVNLQVFFFSIKITNMPILACSAQYFLHRAASSTDPLLGSPASAPGSSSSTGAPTESHSLWAPKSRCCLYWHRKRDSTPPPATLLQDLIESSGSLSNEARERLELQH